MKSSGTKHSTSKLLNFSDGREQRHHANYSRKAVVESRRFVTSNRRRQNQDYDPSAMKENEAIHPLSKFLDSPEELQRSMHELSKDDLFDLRFLRCCRSLYHIADRILNGKEGAEEAVLNSFFIGSCSALEFGDEGAFRSWLIRILIDEALLIRSEAM